MLHYAIDLYWYVLCNRVKHALATIRSMPPCCSTGHVLFSHNVTKVHVPLLSADVQ